MEIVNSITGVRDYEIKRTLGIKECGTKVGFRQVSTAIFGHLNLYDFYFYSHFMKPFHPSLYLHVPLV